MKITLTELRKIILAEVHVGHSTDAAIERDHVNLVTHLRIMAEDVEARDAVHPEDVDVLCQMLHEYLAWCS